MSEFALLFRGAPPTGSPQEREAQVQKWVTWMRELGDRGHLKNPGQPLQATGKLVRDRRVSSDIQVDETIVGGVMFIEAKDIAHAVEISAGSPVFDSGGTVEVRPVMKL